MINENIIKACLEGKPSAQKVLYEHFLGYLYGICRRFPIKEMEMKDLMQEIYIEIFGSLSKFDPAKGEIKYWVKSIAIHKILNYQRKKGLEWVDKEYLPENESYLPSVNEKYDAEYLLTLISYLPDGYRTVFNLSVVDGYSHKEIGQLLGISESSSRSQLSRAKKLLQEKLLSMKT
ncbi:MAG: sigma-70 family RNA polymerase sigma factor [Bacteroidota bacterium]